MWTRTGASGWAWGGGLGDICRCFVQNPVSPIGVACVVMRWAQLYDGAGVWGWNYLQATGIRKLCVWELFFVMVQL